MTHTDSDTTKPASPRRIVPILLLVIPLGMSLAFIPIGVLCLIACPLLGWATSRRRQSVPQA
jgi:uncharacterized membrane protein